MSYKYLYEKDYKEVSRITRKLLECELNERKGKEQ